MPDATNPLPSAENDVCDGCQKRPCVCETVVLPTVDKDAALADLADTIEDAVGVRTLDDETIWQIARYLTASGYARVIPPAGLANACTECGDCFHPVVGPNTDGEPCEWCRDCGCGSDKHTRMERVFPPDVPADDDQLALDHQRPTPVCPECAQGKCPNCTGMALDGDDFVACTCTHGK